MAKCDPGMFFFSPSNHKKFWTADDGPVRLIKTHLDLNEVESSLRSEEYFLHQCLHDSESMNILLSISVVQMVMSNTWQRCCQQSPHKPCCYYSHLSADTVHWGDYGSDIRQETPSEKCWFYAFHLLSTAEIMAFLAWYFTTIKNKL